MRQTFKLLAILLLFASCTPNYEKAIADWVQADKNGTWTDMKFKLEKVYSTRDLTVADSIFILKQKFQKMKEWKLDSCKKVMSRAVLATFNRYNQSAVEEAQKKEFETFKQQLAMMPFHSSYEQRDTTEVLGVYMQCRYSFFSSKLNTRQAEDGIFVLDPKMDKCIRMATIKSDHLNGSLWTLW